MTVVRKPATTNRRRKTSKWANPVTAQFWRCLEGDSKRMAYWNRYAEANYRRSLRDEPMPGIWPKFTARSEIAMAIFDALEQRDKKVPEGFFGGSVEMGIQDLDCYAIAERLLDDKMVQRLGDGPAKKDKKARKKQVER